MVFLGGPRQVGKTTLALDLLKSYELNSSQGLYLNWDFDDDRRSIMERKWSDRHQLIVLDEIHKYPKWKNWLKGIYDKQKSQHNFLVTGSARLDVYRRGGDSLLGRYHYWRLHPFTLNEIPEGIERKEAFDRLMRVGGFPEPFLDNDEAEARRWRRERYDRILKDDVRDLESIQNIQLLSLFVDALRRRVGGQIVLSNIAEEIQVSQKTLKKWLEALERMYVIFIVRPYSRNLARALQKPCKVYFFDNADVIGDEGARFENLVATHILKKLHFIEDTTGYRCELQYIRDKEKREVDFVVVKEDQVEELIEVKFSDDKISNSLSYYAEKLSVPKATQIFAQNQSGYSKGKLEVISALDYFR